MPCTARRKHPQWGPKELLDLLRPRHRRITAWPAISTVGDLLVRHGLVTKRRRRRRPDHPGTVPPHTTAPNDIWAADFKGQFRTGDGLYCYPLTISDEHFRYLLTCHSLRNVQTVGARPAFERAFREYGLPRAIRTDNGVPFATQAIHGLSQLNVWWMRLGIQHHDPTCALTATGAAYCWGRSGPGALGNGSTASSAVPVAVAGGHTFISISTYSDFSSRYACAVDVSGAAYCWGSNTDGTLGDGQPAPLMESPDPTDGTETSSTLPVRVMSSASFVAVSTGESHACAVTTGGTVMCWGRHGWGQLGDGIAEYRNAPVAVSGGLTFTAITVGPDHACGLVAAGDIWCWGDGTNGALGNGTRNSSAVPVKVTGGHQFTQLAPKSGTATCAVASDAATYCWGDNTKGALGSGSADPRATAPVAVAGAHAFTVVNGGGEAALLNPSLESTNCALDNAVAYCWGANFAGQLGNGATSFAGSAVPQQVGGGHSFTAISGAIGHSCAVTGTGSAYCWGENSGGALGLGAIGGTVHTVPVAVNSPLQFRTIDASEAVTCAITTTDDGYCWGSKIPSGAGLADTISTPSAMPGGQKFVTLRSAGFYGGVMGCGVTTGGTGLCWGQNDIGQLGIGAYSSLFPQPLTPVSGGLQFTTIAVGGATTCGLTPAGHAYCWGANIYGGLGNGETGLSTPAVVAGGIIFARRGRP